MTTSKLLYIELGNWVCF